jgi:hypothetical protein
MSAPSTASALYDVPLMELDAIEPDALRTLVRLAIEDHLPPHQFKVLTAAEDSERTLIRQLVRGLAA